VVEDFLHRAQDAWIAVGVLPYAVHKIGAGKVEVRLRDRLAFMVEEVVGFVAEQFGNTGLCGLGNRRMEVLWKGCGREAPRAIRIEPLDRTE
jgi:hypothetical protein